jgi:hypothetical protein
LVTQSVGKREWFQKKKKLNPLFITQTMNHEHAQRTMLKHNACSCFMIRAAAATLPEFRGASAFVPLRWQSPCLRPYFRLHLYSQKKTFSLKSK